MKVLLRLALCAGLMVWCASAQRGGHGGGGGGFHGGGGGVSRGGGSMGGGGYRGGSVGGFGGGYRGSTGFGGGYRGGYGYGNRGGYGYGYRGGYGYRSYGRYYGGYWPYYGFGYGLGWGYPSGYGFDYGPGYYDYGYPYDSYYPDNYAYQGQPNVSVVYPPPQQAAPVVYTQTARPVTHSYDQYGQEVQPAGSANNSPIYLIAMKSGVIEAASSYSVIGDTLHYVTLQHVEKQTPMESIDRTLTNQLNRERRVPLNLPSGR